MLRPCTTNTTSVRHQPELTTSCFTDPAPKGYRPPTPKLYAGFFPHGAMADWEALGTIIVG